MTILYFRKKACFAFLILLTLLPVFAEVPVPSRIVPDDYAVETGRKNEIDTADFIKISLYFSGVKEKDIDYYFGKYKALSSGFMKLLEEKYQGKYTPPEITGEILISYLHEYYFSGYDEMTTYIDILLDKGIFNCVSSSIIYYAVAEESGLDVEGVLTSDHVFCSINTGDDIIDVETTTEYGFNPGLKKEFHDSFGKTGFIYTPPGKYRERNKIGKKEFVSLILQNRIAEYQRQGDFSETVPLAVDRHFILNTESSFNDMMNEFKNYCVVMNNEKQYSEALDFLLKVYEQYGSSEIISETALTLFHNRIIEYLSENEIDMAYDFYETYENIPLISDEVKSSIIAEIDEKELYLVIERGNFSNSIKVLEEKREKGNISSGIYREYLVYIYSDGVERTANNKSWAEALPLAEEGFEKTGDKRLLQLRNTVRYNIGVIYHNRFAEYFNSGEYSRAGEILEEGLSIVPDDKKLLSDIKTMESLK